MDDGYRWYLLKLKHHEQLIRLAFELFRSEDIEPILIKGWIVAKHYPVGVPRYFSDTDLAVSTSDFRNAARFKLSPQFQALNIDLHNGFRHLDTETWEKLFERSHLIPLDGTDIRVLCPEDHLRIICVHWLNDGGANKERLWDIYYAVQNRHEDFDWNLCLDTVGEIRRRWIICAIGLAHKYLGLEIEDLHFAAEAKQVPAWILKTVEKEWATPVRLTSIHLFLNDRKSLVEQIRKRIPPNPIQATIEMEGSFDAWSRTFYQIASFCKRIIPSARKVFRTLLRRLKLGQPK